MLVIEAIGLCGGRFLPGSTRQYFRSGIGIPGRFFTALAETHRCAALPPIDVPRRGGRPGGFLFFPEGRRSVVQRQPGPTHRACKPSLHLHPRGPRRTPAIGFLKNRVHLPILVLLGRNRLRAGT